MCESPDPDGEMSERRARLIDEHGLDSVTLIFRGIWQNLAAMTEENDWEWTTREDHPYFEGEGEREQRPTQRRWSQEALRERRRLRDALREAETPAERERLFAELNKLEADQRLVPVEDESDETDG